MKTKEMKQNRNLNVVSLSVLIFIVAMAIGNVLHAQPPGGQQGPPPIPDSKQIKKIVADLSKEISLSDKQEEQILAFYDDHFDEVKKVMKSGKPDRKEMEALKTEFEKEVSSVLTKEQQELFIDYMKKNSPQQKRGRPE